MFVKCDRTFINIDRVERFWTLSKTTAEEGYTFWIQFGDVRFGLKDYRARDYAVDRIQKGIEGERKLVDISDCLNGKLIDFH